MILFLKRPCYLFGVTTIGLNTGQLVIQVQIILERTHQFNMRLHFAHTVHYVTCTPGVAL